jgi:hypothetical protein
MGLGQQVQEGQGCEGVQRSLVKTSSWGKFVGRGNMLQ